MNTVEYGEASIYLEGGFYTEKTIREILEVINLMNKRAEELSKDMLR